MRKLTGGTYTSQKRGKKTRQGAGRGTKFSTRTNSKRFKKKFTEENDDEAAEFLKDFASK